MTVDTLSLGTAALSLFLGLMILCNVLRIVMTWYPQLPAQNFPYNLVVIPTEPLLALTRKIVPPLGGIDVSPIIAVGLFSLLREILVGQQGLLTMMLYAQ
ncbi:MAG: YggT family protein [Pseudanabaenaceae cyanobacterium]|jgi:YggT family protein